MATEYRECTPPDNDVKECYHCGAEFIGKREYNGYCSKSCQRYDLE